MWHYLILFFRNLFKTLFEKCKPIHTSYPKTKRVLRWGYKHFLGINRFTARCTISKSVVWPNKLITCVWFRAKGRKISAVL